ncbi:MULTISPECIES: hypothetical protein [unclassified Alistipes]|uniref:hypothetical protein n=1 Tax=unclassified Alistipes TaxID=2608932 RepID=UPI0025885380|nr:MULTISPECIES: hypothetical protein [unclassified Alistipes]HUN14139.1 hypothetical protein [Alistipes sp.]
MKRLKNVIFCCRQEFCYYFCPIVSAPERAAGRRLQRSRPPENGRGERITTKNELNAAKGTGIAKKRQAPLAQCLPK